MSSWGIFSSIEDFDKEFMRYNMNPNAQMEVRRSDSSHHSRFFRFSGLTEKFGIYKDDHASQKCTPSCLPEFIRIEVAKRNE